jgi:nucleoside-diphosphate-sugar epimerase
VAFDGFNRIRAVTRVLVTGASGFVGLATLTALARSNLILRAALRKPLQFPLPAEIEIVELPDLASDIDWKLILDGVDQVVHLAAVADSAAANPALHDRVNRWATERLAIAAANARISRFVFISSIRAQSGPSADHALTELDTPSPTDAYGRSKLAAEAAIRAAGVPFCILRPVLLYGPGVKGNFALLLRAARSRWPLPIKDFINRRSLLGVDNLVSAIEFALSSPAAAGETYVVADPGPPPRLADVIAILRQAEGRRALIFPFPKYYFEKPIRLLRPNIWERLASNLRVDPGKLLAAGWQPLHDTRDGLTALIQAPGAAAAVSRSRNTMPPSTPTPKT